MKKLSLLIIAAAILLTAGCAPSASGPKFTLAQPPDQTVPIYVFYSTGRPIRCDILVDSKYVGELLKDGYLVTNVPPGTHTVTADNLFSYALDLDVKANQPCWLELVHLTTWYTAFEELDETVALPKIKKLKLSTPKS